MTCHVVIVGLPSPAGCDAAQTWRAAASIVEQRLHARFGPAISFEYAELFSPAMTPHRDIEAQIAAGEAVPPIVVIDGVRRFAGGKLRVSAIERAVADIVGSGIPAPAAREEAIR